MAVEQIVFDVASFHNVTLERAAEMLPRMTAEEIEAARGDVEIVPKPAAQR